MVIGALAERIPLPCSIATVEALACRRAVLFAMEMSIFEATIEGDAEIVILALFYEVIYYEVIHYEVIGDKLHWLLVYIMRLFMIYVFYFMFYEIKNLFCFTCIFHTCVYVFVECFRNIQVDSVVL